VMWGYEGCKVTVIDIWYIWYDFKFDIHWCHMMYANIFLIYIYNMYILKMLLRAKCQNMP
jgi:hypothetical protein